MSVVVKVHECGGEYICVHQHTHDLVLELLMKAQEFFLQTLFYATYSTPLNAQGTSYVCT